MKFKVQKNLWGKRKVVYNCPHCDKSLWNPLDDAGLFDECPECGGEFNVPGKSWILQESARIAQAKLEAKERAEKRAAAASAVTPVGESSLPSEAGRDYATERALLSYKNVPMAAQQTVVIHQNTQNNDGCLIVIVFMMIFLAGCFFPPIWLLLPVALGGLILLIIAKILISLVRGGASAVRRN